MPGMELTKSTANLATYDINWVMPDLIVSAMPCEMSPGRPRFCTASVIWACSL